MTEQDWAVRTHAIRHLADTGRSPTTAAMATALGLDQQAVEASLVRLADAHALALRSGTTDLWMVHPFSAVPTGYRVVSATTSWWANCAWDAVAIPTMLGVDARIEAGCPDCGRAFDLAVENGELQGDDGVVHFVVPPSRFWEDVGFT